MTQQEYENKIKELEKQIEELKTAKIEESQLKRWKPKEKANETYYLVTTNGEISNTRWLNDNFDKWLYLTDNCFKTKEEAEEYKKQIEYTARYKNYIEEHSEPIDWKNKEQSKFCVRYDNTVEMFMVDEYTYYSYQGTIYASSEQIIEDAIKEIGEDNFKKYVLGVK